MKPGALKNTEKVRTYFYPLTRKILFRSLKEILELLVDWIIVSDVVDGELRMSLYAALVTFLQLTDVEPEHQEIVGTNSMYVSRLDGSRLVNFVKLF